jgi:hypothetical protein
LKLGALAVRASSVGLVTLFGLSVQRGFALLRERRKRVRRRFACTASFFCQTMQKRQDQRRFRPASLRARYFCQTIQKYPKDLDAREGAGLRPVPPDQVRGRLCDARPMRAVSNSLRSDRRNRFFRLALRFSAPSRANARSTADGASRSSLHPSREKAPKYAESVGQTRPRYPKNQSIDELSAVDAAE